MASLSGGEIILCIVCLTIVTAVILVSAVGNPFVLVQFCVPRASLPSQSRTSRQSSRASRWFSNWSCFGFVFDGRSYREQIQLRREHQERISVDEQIRRLEQLVEAELELRERIANGATDRATHVQLSRVQRFRYGLAMRTREERRRRRLLLIQEQILADEQAAAEEEAHFKDTLSLEEKRMVLKRVLEFHQYEAAHDGGLIAMKNERKRMGMAAACTMDGSSRSRVTICSEGSMSVDEEKGASDGEGEDFSHYLASNRTCAICIYEYEDGEELAMRSERCPHIFHRECYFQWLIAKRADCCPVCRSSILTEDEWRDTHSQIIGENAEQENEKDKERHGVEQATSTIG